MAPEWLDDTETIDLLDGEGESFDEPEGFDGAFGDQESVRDDRRRRASIARRQLANRQRLAAMRQRSMVPARPVTTQTAVRKTQAAVQELNLRNQVQTDTISSALASRDRRLSGAESAIGGSAVAGQVQRFLDGSFPGIGGNIAVKTALPLAPLIFLRPKQGSGFGGFIADPRVWTTGLAAVLAFAGTFVNRKTVEFSPAPGRKLKDGTVLTVILRQGGQVTVPTSTSWIPLTSATATIDSNGKVTVLDTNSKPALFRVIADGVEAVGSYITK